MSSNNGVQEASAAYSAQQNGHTTNTQVNNAQTLITQHLDLWSSAIIAKQTTGRGSSKKIELYGVKKLRELILELAMKGSIVESSSNCAKSLVKRAVERKLSVGLERKIRIEKAVFSAAPLFMAPDGWCWVAVGHVAHVLGGKRVPRGYKLQDSPTPYAYIRVTDMKDGSVDVSGLKYVDKEIHEKISKYIINRDDVYVTIAGTIGAVGTIPNDLDGMHLTENAAKLVFGEIDKRFLVLLFSCDYVQSQFQDAVNQMAQPKLSLNSIKSTSIAIPPLEEQHRIVAKVDELMALCDRLENQTEQSLEAHATLVDTLLNALTQAQSHTELMESWARLEQNWDILFPSTIAGLRAIDKLKQTILQLAVMGKLVPQDANDEPASELLKRIAAEKAQLIKDKKIKKQKPLPPITDEEKPFELPEGWELVRLSELMPSFQNGASSRGDKGGKEITVLRLADIKEGKISLADTRSLPIAGDNILRYALEKNDVLIIRVNGSADIVGRFVLCEEPIDAIYCDHFIRMRFPFSVFESSFLSLIASSKLVRSRIEDMFVSTAGQKTVNQKHIGSLVVVVPPLEEQKRIVAKVEALTSLCDQLKQRLQTAQQTQQHFTDTVVAGALS